MLRAYRFFLSLSGISIFLTVFSWGCYIAFLRTLPQTTADLLFDFLIYSLPIVAAVIIMTLIFGNRTGKNFFITFGFKPLKEERARRIFQPLVDKELASRAQKFRKACDAEENLTKNKNVFKDMDALKNDTEAAIISVNIEKKNFWFAHGLAKIFDFKTRPSFKDYLKA